MKFRYFLLLLAVVLTFSCRKEMEDPNWDVDILAPILKSSLNIDDLLNDTLTNVNPDSSVSLVYQYLLYGFNLDTMFTLPDTTGEYSAKLESISLYEIEVEERISLGDIALYDIENGDGTLGNAIIVAHNLGWPIAIDPFSLTDPMEVPLDANEYFETMTLIEGWMDIEIENGLPVDITNLTFELRNESDPDPFASVTFPVIPSGETVIDSIDLAGEIIEGSLIGKIVSIESPGSGGTPVPIDTSDALIATITVRDLLPYSATAVFPAQNLIDRGETTPFDLNTVELTEMIIKQGYIHLTAFNTLEDSLHFTYSVPTATYNNIPYEFTGTIPPAVGGEASYIDQTENLAGYLFNLRGIGPVEQIYGDLNGNDNIDDDTVNTFYQTLVARIDSTGELISLSLDDSVYIHIDFADIVPEYAVGWLGKDTLPYASEIESDVFDRIAGGEIDLEDVRLSMTVTNEIGAQAGAQINELMSINTSSGNQYTLDVSNLDQPFTVDKPNDPHSIDIPVEAVVNSLEINESNSNTSELIENLPDRFIYDIDLITNPVASYPGLALGTDFIYYGDEMSADLNIELPLSLISNSLSLVDTTDFNLAGETIEDINNGNLILYVENSFPLKVKIQLYMLDENLDVFDSLMYGQQIIQAGAVNTTTGIVTSPELTKITIPVSGAKLDALANTQKIKIIAMFDTSPASQFVKIYSYYYINFKIIGDFNYHIH